MKQRQSIDLHQMDIG